MGPQSRCTPVWGAASGLRLVVPRVPNSGIPAGARYQEPDSGLGQPGHQFPSPVGTRSQVPAHCASPRRELWQSEAPSHFPGADGLLCCSDSPSCFACIAYTEIAHVRPMCPPERPRWPGGLSLAAHGMYETTHTVEHMSLAPRRPVPRWQCVPDDNARTSTRTTGSLRPMQRPSAGQ